MLLFDDGHRTDNAYASHSDLKFDSYNRLARPFANAIRQFLERCFQHYPETAQPELKKRLQSGDVGFRAATFEMVLHEMFLSLGFGVQLHPDPRLWGATCDKAPDFLVSTPRGESFVLEATVVEEMNDKERATENRMNTVKDAINQRVRAPHYFLRISYKKGPLKNVPVAQLARRIQEWVDSLDYETTKVQCRAGFYSRPKFDCSHGEWKLTVKVIPRSEPAHNHLHGNLGWVSPAAVRGDSARAIQSSLKKKKPSLYGIEGIPYVIAVNAMAKHAGVEDGLDALYGKWGLTRFTDPTTGKVVKSTEGCVGDGFWRNKGAPKNRGVSAILKIDYPFEALTMPANCHLFHHPFATNPLPRGMLPFPQVYALANGEIERKDGRTLADILLLPDDWGRHN